MQNILHSAKIKHERGKSEKAESGPVEEGNVGGGTGMLCYEFKGGSGTSSRKLPEKLGGWTIGAFAQTNFGRRYQLTIAGVPVGAHLKENTIWTDGENPFKQDDGSLIIIIATDAPLLPHQLKQLAKRASLGMARTGSLGGNGSGDIFLAFSTANPNAARGNEKGLETIQSLSNNFIDPLLAVSGYLAVSRGRGFLRADVLYCFNSASGKLEWKKDLGKRLIGIPLVSDSYLYVRSSDNRVNCLNQVTGDKLWDIPAPAGRWTLADGNIFVSSTDYKIYCLKTSDR